MNKLLIVTTLLAGISPCFALGSLENPVAGSTESGIGVISGWHCTAANIDVTIDGMSLGKAGSGTSRGDTTSVCGRSNTGYSLLFNYNDLTPGAHSLSLYADGQLLEVRQFNTVQSGGASFVTGLVSRWTLAGFPSSGKKASIEWSQAKQSFVVTGITGITPPSAPPPTTTPPSTTSLSSLNGSYRQMVKIAYSGYDSSGRSCYNLLPEMRVNATINVITSDNQAQVTASTLDGTCNFKFTASNGYSASSFNMSGSSTCKDSNLNTTTNRNVTGTNISKMSERLYGTIVTRTDYCTQTITL